MSFERYAIYWVPRPNSALAIFAKEWFGADVETGEVCSEPRKTFGLSTSLAENAAASPRRYGIHATLKAPFRLRDEAKPETLGDAVAAFCSRRRAVRSGKLRLHRFSRYLALTPESTLAEIDWLAAECVTHFDPFRAPLSDEDRARRPARISSQAATHLEQFGYPDIFDRFMFHITLAGPLQADELDAVEAALSPAVTPLLETPLLLEDLCLCGDPGGGGLFRVIRRVPFL